MLKTLRRSGGVRWWSGLSVEKLSAAVCSRIGLSFCPTSGAVGVCSFLFPMGVV